MTDVKNGPELVPLATMCLNVRRPQIIDGAPRGARLQGSILGGSSADWFVVGANNPGVVDARLLLKTRDDAMVLIEYGGRMTSATAYAPPSTSRLCSRLEIHGIRG